MWPSLDLFLSPGSLGLCSHCSAKREHVCIVCADGWSCFRSQSISNPNVRNFGRSLLAGYCPTYMPDLVLHGTSSDEKLKQCLAADLVHTVQVSDPSWEFQAADQGVKEGQPGDVGSHRYSHGIVATDAARVTGTSEAAEASGDVWSWRL